MLTRDYSALLTQLAEQYAQHSPRSAAWGERARRVLVDGGSHAVRLVEPFPPRIVAAHGAWLEDEDGHEILDFWQGHTANLLGHNPPQVTGVLAEAFGRGWGMQTGMADALEVETAELMCRLTGAERVRFTTSGTLATMYAIMLARAYTNRSLVLKVGGGWHGAQPFGLKGVGFSASDGFQALDSAGLSASTAAEVLVTRYNDTQRLEEDFRRYGDRLACFIVEPFMGAGGGMPALPDYLRTARALCDRYGALLIADEVIAGFRFRAGDATRLYGIQPDLATFAKIMGGGMPVTAVAGRADLLGLAGRAGGSRVKFQGGTYSAHPASMLAARTMLQYTAEHEAEIYPRLAQLGEQFQRGIEEAFQEEGIYARCSGYGNGVLPASSVIHVHFPHRPGQEVLCPDDAQDPNICDTVLGNQVLRLALLLRDVHVVHGVGALSTAHGEAELKRAIEDFRAVAYEIRRQNRA